MAEVQLTPTNEHTSGVPVDPGRASGPVEQQPPYCNTGVALADTPTKDTPSTEPSAFKVSLDHIAGTVKLTRPHELTAVLRGTLELSKRSFLGYPHSATITTPGGSVCRMGYGALDRPGELHFQVPGKACGELGYPEVQALLKFINERGKATRIDAAFDDKSGLLTPGKAYDSALKGNVVSRSRKFQHIVDQEGGRQGVKSTGETTYFGKRVSETFVRVYDKSAEQKVEGPWCRLEVEWKGRRAATMCSLLQDCPEADFGKYLTMFIRDVVDFRDCTYEMSAWERSRAEPLEWWSILTGHLARTRFLLEPLKPHIQKLAQYFTRCIAPSLAVLCAHKDLGQEWVMRELVRAPDRWSEKHLALFKQKIPAMGQV